MKKHKQFVFLTVFFLLFGGTFLSINKAQIQVVKLEAEAFDKSLISFNLTKQRIKSYLSNLQDKITIKSYQHSDDLIKIFQNPDENNDLLDTIQNKIKSELPNVNLSTMANDQGEMIVPDFDGYIDESCQENLKDFAEHNKFEIRIHPNSIQYHFDIMVRYFEPKNQLSGIFFTSFSTDHLKDILKQGEKEQNQLFLLFNPVPDLIEVSSEGSRQQLNRTIKLSAEEINRISISEVIKNTSWTLVNLPSRNFLTNKKMRVYAKSIFEILFLYLISGILFYTIYNEVTKNKKISERYLLFLEKTDIAFLVINKNGIVQFGNSALVKIAEFNTIDEIIGQHISRWINPDVWEQIKEYIKTVDKEGQVIGIPVKQQKKNGKTQSLLIDIIADHSSRQPAYALFCKDMSEINQIEHLKLERQAAILSEQSKSEFLANISHELRTPMHGILSYASMGIKRVNTVTLAQLKKYFTNIQISGIRLLGLLNDLLDLSQLEAGQMTMSFISCDLNTIVKNSIMEQQSKINEQGLQLIFDSDDSADTIGEMDTVRITQVIANLLSNAIKFTPENGQIKISTYADHLMLQGKKSAAISLSISNEGDGIPEEDLELIFDKFKQSSNIPAKSKMGSTGLGLAICKEIIQAHQGVISARSEPGKSATFIMTIPKKQIE